jgi:hypothetical protein
MAVLSILLAEFEATDLAATWPIIHCTLFSLSQATIHHVLQRQITPRKSAVNSSAGPGLVAGCPGRWRPAGAFVGTPFVMLPCCRYGLLRGCFGAKNGRFSPLKDTTHAPQDSGQIAKTRSFDCIDNQRYDTRLLF